MQPIRVQMATPGAAALRDWARARLPSTYAANKNLRLAGVGRISSLFPWGLDSGKWAQSVDRDMATGGQNKRETKI